MVVRSNWKFVQIETHTYNSARRSATQVDVPIAVSKIIYHRVPSGGWAEIGDMKDQLIN